MKLTLSEDRRPIISARQFAREFAECANLKSGRDVDMIEEIAASAPLGDSSIHGFRHWLTVLSNGLAIIEHTPELQSNVFRSTMILFALFHDSRRETDSHCTEHGKLASIFLTHGLTSEQAKWIHSTFGITDIVRKLASFACEIHTICETPISSPLLRVGSPSPAVGTLSEEEAMILGACLDADRLDLGRVGIDPHVIYLFTPAARKHASR